MGLFGKRRTGIDFENIVSVVILEQTNLYQNKSNWGISVGSELHDVHAIAMPQNVPTGTEFTFSVTYRNGSKEILKCVSGTAECTKLLQLAIDPPEFHKEPTSEKQFEPFVLQKNQLPNGNYQIGTDIPEGTYDFHWVFGNGSISIYKNDKDTTLGNTLYFQNMGNTYEYEYRQCVNVKCSEGNVLSIVGNLVVSIAKSKRIELDL